MFVVIGSVTADLLVHSDTPFSTLGGDGFRSSNLVFTEQPLKISVGGNGGNSAYVLAGLGQPTAICSAVGQDLLGEALVNWLRSRTVDLSGLLRHPTRATSSSTIIMSSASQQTVFHHLGATAAAHYETMPETLFQQAAALLASSYPIMTGLRPHGFAAALARVHAAGGLTALDIGPAIGEPVTLAEIAPLLPTVDYLIGNTHELTTLTGASDWQTAAQRVLAAGAANVVIKQGASGAAIWTPTQQRHHPAFAVDAKMSVGAGDSFNVGLLDSLRRGLAPEAALRFANAVAALVVSSPQGVLDAPTRAQVEAFLDDHS